MSTCFVRDLASARKIHRNTAYTARLGQALLAVPMRLPIPARSSRRTSKTGVFAEKISSITKMELTTVYKSLNAQACFDRSLVLTAMDIEHVVQRQWMTWRVLVDPRLANAANEQLRLYVQENQAAHSAVRAPLRFGTKLGVLVYCAVLLIGHFLQIRWSFGLDWTTAGRVDVAAIRAGEYWRTVTALTLHRDAAHLLSNLGFGAIFGALLSRQIGGGLAWLLILVTGAAGNWMNAGVQEPQHLAIGASTAVFSALGLLAAILWLAKELSQDNWAKRLSPVIGGLWMLAWLGTGDAQTDVVAHLTGFIAGFACGALLTKLPNLQPSHALLQWLAGLGAIMGILSAWTLAIT